ncbi:hypothetical protein BDZ91DRAFT_789039 [Kalaharituber pfeilii]|nr:hypothetical protein BDZ91DRAFT_789039 [Kalaharituber pfeilii]
MTGGYIVPLPKKPLGQHCSVLANGTLYTFSETAFQSLDLNQGSKWEELPLQFGTKGAICVHVDQNTPDEALFIVGGKSANTTMVPENGYMGIQKYTFKTQKWEMIQTPDPIAYNLTNVGAIYLKETADKTQPLLAPILLPWGVDGALIVGGSSQNNNLRIFSPKAGWRDLGIPLKEGLPSRQAGATLVDGDDGSRMLLTFDLSTSPVKFVRTKVKDANGDFVSPENNGSFGGTLGLTESNWPTYNGTYAPEGTEKDFSITSNGVTLVFTGGNEESPLCIFNSRQNLWENPTAVFQEGGQIVVDDGDLNPDGTQEMPTDTPSASATATAGSSGGSGKPNNIRLLFIVLGSIVGLLAILGIIMFFVRRKKIQWKANLGRSNTERSKMSFQDRGLGFMKESNVVDEMPPPGSQQRGSGWSKYFSGNSATNLVNLPSRAYSAAGSSVYDTTNSISQYPYTTDGQAQPVSQGHSSIRSQGLVLDLPGSNLNVSAKHFSTETRGRRKSDASFSSIGASSYSSGIPESIVEKSTWDPTGNSAGFVGADNTRYQVQNSPRGWGVLTKNRASSVYPESAVTVYPDEPGSSRNGGVPARNQSNKAYQPVDDVSWLNLRH